MENELKVSFALTFSQFRVLDALLGRDELSQRELAEVIGVTPAVVTRQAEVLAGRGLLEQRENPRSRREKLIVATRKGEQAAVDAGKAIMNAQKRLFEPLDVQEELAIERGLSKMPPVPTNWHRRF
ncbi:MarR family transcriptional regulator [Candidatus Saccharibacteria bacterium]|nr:MarR family transcriptional regulator [Candidatus Saccharibacteria bacterium]